MASYSIQATNVSQSTPVLAKGPITIFAETAVYWRVGTDPVADSKCAFIPAQGSIELRIPVKCSRIAFLAVNSPGHVSVTEQNGVKASCSA